MAVAVAIRLLMQGSLEGVCCRQRSIRLA
jgi:hypothetical protein